MRERASAVKVPFTLYKMLFASFINWYLLAQFLGILVVVIADLFGQLDMYLSKNLSAPEILKLTALLIPKAIWFTMPFVIMFGIIMAISNFYQSNELIAIFTSGISYARFTMPIIIFSVFLSILMIFIDSFGVIYAMRYREQEMQKINSKKNDDYSNITLRSEKEGYFWHAADFDAGKNKLEKPIIFKINENYLITERIDANYAIYTKTGWLLYSGTERVWDDSGTLTAENNFERKTLLLPEKPSIFKSSEYEIENMNIIEAYERIKLLERINVEHRKESTDFHKKFSFPCILIIFSIFSVGVATLSKVYILIVGLALSIVQAIVYYIAQFLLLDNLAYTGIISPVAGAWATFFLFLPVAIALVIHSKT